MDHLLLVNPEHLGNQSLLEDLHGLGHLVDHLLLEDLHGLDHLVHPEEIHLVHLLDL